MSQFEEGFMNGLLLASKGGGSGSNELDVKSVSLTSTKLVVTYTDNTSSSHTTVYDTFGRLIKLTNDATGEVFTITYS